MNKSFVAFSVIFAVILVFILIFIQKMPEMSKGSEVKEITVMPEIKGDIWFNSKPLTPDDLKGKLVLVDFFAYSCVNCQRDFPAMREWYKKYKNEKFVMIGIHTPEFEFEKDKNNVEKAIKALNITWPVVLDNDSKLWNAFNNRYWPAKYLAGDAGKIVYTHFGEGDYEEVETVLQSFLKSTHAWAKFEPVKSEDIGGVCYMPTPETYCGYKRGHLTNTEGYAKDKVFDYKQVKLLPVNSIALKGKFIAKEEYVESNNPGSEVQLHFTGTEVNLVLKTDDKEAVVELIYNDLPLNAHNKGIDVSKDSKVTIKLPTMYNLFKTPYDLSEGTLIVRAVTGNFQAYAFTFAGCVEKKK